MKNSSGVPEPSSDLLQRAVAVRRSSRDLAQSTNDQRKSALISMADALTLRSREIVEANLEDLRCSSDKGLSEALVARLKLDDEKLGVAIDGVRKVASLPDPLGLRQMNRELDHGLLLERITVPLGV